MSLENLIYKENPSKDERVQEIIKKQYERLKETLIIYEFKSLDSFKLSLKLKKRELENSLKISTSYFLDECEITPQTLSELNSYLNNLKTFEQVKNFERIISRPDFTYI